MRKEHCQRYSKHKNPAVLSIFTVSTAAAFRAEHNIKIFPYFPFRCCARLNGSEIFPSGTELPTKLTRPKTKTAAVSTYPLATPHNQTVNNSYGDPTTFSRNYTAHRAGNLVWRVSNTAGSKYQQ
jgi:hypothetical protein